MDSTAIQVIADNTTATMALTGTIWVFMGFMAFMSVGLYCLSQTIHGR